MSDLLWILITIACCCYLALGGGVVLVTAAWLHDDPEGSIVRIRNGDAYPTTPLERLWFWTSIWVAWPVWGTRFWRTTRAALRERTERDRD